ncbi:MAG: type IV pilus twitching motility protein PilT [Nitrospinae bacterium]|nr:type IV pilus twitching motility protein PilT [Nitrospinota bacterium]
MRIDDLLHLAIEKQASDLHLKVPQPPVMRIQGDLVIQENLPRLTPTDLQEILEVITSPNQRKTFERDHELDMSYSLSGVGRFRVNASLQRGTVALSFRPIPLTIPRLDDLGLPEVIKTLAMKSRGLVLVTGHSGSGKSTTLAAMVDYINENRPCRIVTVEDPIEFLHRDKRSMILQRELEIDTRSFATALKHVLRQDPDVILVGEMRDLETIQTVLTAAETGHLVLATLHTVSAVQTVDRVIDVFPAHQQPQVRLQLSALLEGVICQTLLPRVDGKERVLAAEIMIGTPAISNLIRDGKAYQIRSVLQTNARFGMQTLDQALKTLYQKKLITLEDALAKSNDPEELRRGLS